MQSKCDNNEPESISEKISAAAFKGIQKLIFDSAGITISDTKKALVSSRLSKRLRILNMQTYDEYLKYLTAGNGAKSAEFQIFIDSLTTNETYFFREPQHFDFLKNEILKKKKTNTVFRIWSAASSSGEEAYTLAMILADEIGIDESWEILGTDISSEVIASAKMGVYNAHRIRLVPKSFHNRYFLKGVGVNEGNVAVVPELKKHVRFESYNLINSPERREMFDVIFCRNVLIYFNQDTKKKVMKRLCNQLKMGSYLMTGHSESLHGMIKELTSVKPSIYLKGKG